MSNGTKSSGAFDAKFKTERTYTTFGKEYARCYANLEVKGQMEKPTPRPDGKTYEIKFHLDCGCDTVLKNFKYAYDKTFEGFRGVQPVSPDFVTSRKQELQIDDRDWTADLLLCGLGRAPQALNGNGRRPVIRSKVTGEQKTELDQVISGLPWQDAFTFGAGVDAITGGVAGTAIKPFTPTKRTVKKSSEHYRFIQSDSELNREIETSVAGKYNIEGVTVSASASYLTKIKYSELIITLVADYESQYDGYDEVDTYELTDDAKRLISDPPKFRKSFGDYFIAGGRRSSQFTGVYVCQSSSVESMDEFKASFGAEAPEVFSAEGSARFLQAAKEHNVNISADLFMDGYSGTSPNGPWTPEKILGALGWFKENEQGIDLQSKLKHYSTIDRDYPRTIDVAPEVFVDLRQLYTKLWDIRARYSSCPGYYQEQLKRDYTALDYGVVANQTILVEDLDKRLEYQQQSDALLSALNDVFARMDFYFKVKKAVGTEPAENQSIEEGSGQQTWMYGYSTYTKSTAVVIHSNSMTYSESWHIGWRERTLEFGPNGNYLLVGWQVISNWNDGSNGQWWKAVNQILLTDHGAVHVKSQYDRGCDWSVVFYYVDAKDYQF